MMIQGSLFYAPAWRTLSIRNIVVLTSCTLYNCLIIILTFRVYTLHRLEEATLNYLLSLA